MNPGNGQPANDQQVSLAPALLLVRALATSVVVFLRRGFGECFLGPQAVLVILVVPMFTFLWPLSKKPQSMLYFLGCYLIACIAARIDLLEIKRRGELRHSRYSGRPHLMRLFPKLSEGAIKTFIEPALCIAVAFILFGVNEPLGVYLFYSGLALFFSEGCDGLAEKQLARRQIDVFIEQQSFASRFHRRIGRRRAF